MNDEHDDGARDTILVGTADAARFLNRSERTIRKYIDAGKLIGHKVGNAWLVELSRSEVEEAGIDIPEISETDQLVGEGADRPRLASTRAGTGPAVPPAAVDLGPMAKVITELTAQVGELSASAAMWQERARSLEEQNREIRLALTAGESKIEETEVERRIQAAAAAAKEEGRAEGKAEALATTDERPWWRKLLG